MIIRINPGAQLIDIVQQGEATLSAVQAPESLQSEFDIIQSYLCKLNLVLNPDKTKLTVCCSQMSYHITLTS